MKLSIIIVTYNSGAVIGGCLDGLGDWMKNALVVDNGSRDDSVAQVERRGVDLIRLQGNTGFARAANTGARRAGGDVVCFLNPDCLPHDQLMRAGLAAAGGPEPVAAVPGLCEDGRPPLAGRQPGYTRLKLACDLLNAAYPLSRLVRRLEQMPAYHQRGWFWPHGACLFIKRGLFLDLGGFDPRLFTYMEDVDLGWKLYRAGGEVIQMDQSLRHQTATGSRVSKSRRRYLMARGRLKYAWLHYGPLMATGLGLAVLPGLTAKWLLK